MAWSRRIFVRLGVLRICCVYWIFRWLSVVPTAVLMVAYAAQGQAGSGTVGAPQDIESALHQMADRADVIFVGQVIAVQRMDGGNVASGVVAVRFRVDQAVRGCVAGEPYTMREWAGLWEGDAQRYRVGERLLMLLHAPGASGMSSPVDGLDGAIPIIRGGGGVLVANNSARLAPAAVDLRWVGIKMLRAVVYGSGARPAGQTRALRGAAGETITAAPVMASAAKRAGEGSVPSQQASVDVVVGMLSSWQGEHAVR